MIRMENNNQFAPMPVAVIGCEVDGKFNFMAEGWITRVNGNPPMIGLSLAKNRHSCKGIEDNKAFSVNYVAADLLKETDHVGMVSGNKIDKSGVFATFNGENPKAPLLQKAVLALECRLVEKVLLPSHTFYVGEIVATWAQEDSLGTAGRVDFLHNPPLILSMPDNHYHLLGPVAGAAFNAANRSL
jgi:flavin reductase (DIM6/NTAB) family NADH-FMN oxidoreductase RutF